MAQSRRYLFLVAASLNTAYAHRRCAPRPSAQRPEKTAAVAYAGHVVRNGNITLAGRPCPASEEVNKLYNKIFYFFHIICHQKPERSFFIGKTQLFLCSRCTGIYLSIFIIILFYPVMNIKQTYLHLYSLLAIALLLNFLTYINIFDTNMIRFILGSLIGIPSGLILIKSIKNIFSKENDYD